MDAERDEEVVGVVEVNTAEGWLVAVKSGADGRPLIAEDGLNWATERLTGRVEIRRPERADG